MELTATDMAAYLKRIGVAEPSAPSIEALTSLTEAHVTSIPFENLDILLGRPISLDLESLVHKLVIGNRGGYCFEHNTLLCAVLRALGYQVAGLAARVGSQPGKIRPRTHMLLLVDMPSGHQIVDVGFGGDGLMHPIELRPLASVRSPTSHHRLVFERGEWSLQVEVEGQWTDLYSFDLVPQHAVDYEVANHFTSTHPSSPFVSNLTVQRVRPDRRSVLRNRSLTVRQPDRSYTESLQDAQQLLALLKSEFDLRFPPGTRFRWPEF